MPRVSESLCDSCNWAHIQKGYAESEEVVLCAFLRPARLVPFKVRHCTDYSDKGSPPMGRMLNNNRTLWKSSRQNSSQWSRWSSASSAALNDRVEAVEGIGDGIREISQWIRD